MNFSAISSIVIVNYERSFFPNNPCGGFSLGQLNSRKKVRSKNILRGKDTPVCRNNAKRIVRPTGLLNKKIV